MKKLLFAAFFVMSALLSSEATAQKELKISEETRAMSLGQFNCLVMQLPGTKKKDVEGAWGDYVKKYKGKTKSNKSGEQFTDDATIKDMSPNTVDIYAKVVDLPNNGGTELTVWFNVGLTYLSSKDFPQQYAAGDKLLREFAGTVSAALLAEELKAEEKKLKDFEEELKSLEKAKSGHDKDILNAKETIKKQEDNIRKSEEEIKANLKSQEDKQKQINDQKKAVEDAAARLKAAGGKK